MKDERRDLKRRLRQIQEEVGRVEVQRQGMFSRSLENLDAWDGVEEVAAKSGAGPIMVPGEDGVMWDLADCVVNGADPLLQGFWSDSPVVGFDNP